MPSLKDVLMASQLRQASMAGPAGADMSRGAAPAQGPLQPVQGPPMGGSSQPPPPAPLPPPQQAQMAPPPAPPAPPLPQAAPIVQVRVAKQPIMEDDEFAGGPLLKAFNRETPQQEAYDTPEHEAMETPEQEAMEHAAPPVNPAVQLYEQRMKAMKLREMDSEQRF